MLEAGLALGLTLSALVLLPGLHHAGKTVRSRGLTDSMANEWSMPAVRGLELFSPHVLGHVDRANVTQYWGRSLYGQKTLPFIYSLYPGLVISLLALAAWRTRRRALLGWGHQTWDEGWRALLDGQPPRIYRTELALSGVVVPSGKHKIEFAYRDPWMTPGLGISGASALTCLALLVL